MRKDKKLALSKDKRDAVVSKIKDNFDKERDEKIDDLAAELLLDLITKEIAPEFYNRGIRDAYGYMSERLEEMLDIQR